MKGAKRLDAREVNRRMKIVTEGELRSSQGECRLPLVHQAELGGDFVKDGVIEFLLVDDAGDVAEMLLLAALAEESVLRGSP